MNIFRQLSRRNLQTKKRTKKAQKQIEKKRKTNPFKWLFTESIKRNNS